MGTYLLAEANGPCVMRQAWRDLLFLHWEVDAGLVQTTLPDGLTVDTFGETGGATPKAYVGIVPFQMAKVRPRFCPPVPGVSWFGELNLRTYVVGPDGRPGVWFYSLDAHQRLAVWLARTLFKLPYHYAKIRQNDSPRPDGEPGRRIDYHWQRNEVAAAQGGPAKESIANRKDASDDPAFLYDVPHAADAKPAEVGALAHWLVERYLLFSRRPLFAAGPGNTVPGSGGAIDVGRVDHEPYRVAAVEVPRADVSLFGLNGFELPIGPPVSALWSPGVDVSIYPLRKAETADPG